VEDQVKGMMVAHIINGDMEPYWSQYGILRGTTGLHLDMELLTTTVWVPPPTQSLIHPSSSHQRCPTKREHGGGSGQMEGGGTRHRW